MEVLHGNQSGEKHSRRRSDKLALGDNRTLDWGTLDSDISLYPHSPLALAKVLSHQGGFLDLLPDEPSTRDSSSDPASATNNGEDQPHSGLWPANDSVNPNPAALRNRRAQKDRFNLLTRHAPSELLNQCKKILVENALVKNKGERQLYLAAGFISWPDVNNAESRKRAPLLLYPALLVRVPEESRYEVRLTGDSPEFNHAFVQHADQQFDIRLPAFDHESELDDFLAQVAHSLQGQNSVTLEFEIALGNASLMRVSSEPTPRIELPDVPEHFDVNLAMSITGNKTLNQLGAVLQLIPNYVEVAPANKPVQQVQSAPPESVAGLRKYAARLAAEGLDHVEFKHLTSLPTMITKWSESVQCGLDTATISSVLNRPELTAREMIRLASIIELIDKAPEQIAQLAHADLCYSGTTLLLRRARHQAKLIDDELEALQAHFVLDKVPAKSQLLSLMSELGGTLDHGPDLVDADYFNARRQFMEFSIEKPGNLTGEHRRLLSQLAKVLRFRELFVNNTEYRTALGPGYKGLRTDWNQLTIMSEYARELAEVLESETLAAAVLHNWSAFRNAYSSELDTLQNAAEGCRRLLGTVGAHWHSQSVPALLKHALMIGSRLVEWRSLYGSYDNHADKTPAIVLSSFSGKSLEDVVVETQVDETRTRIDRQLSAGEITREQITDTLGWLAAATHAASGQELTIDAIVEHLQIA